MPCAYSAVDRVGQVSQDMKIIAEKDQGSSSQETCMNRRSNIASFMIKQAVKALERAFLLFPVPEMIDLHKTQGV